MAQFDYQAILNTYRQLQTQANEANQQRYDDILSTIQQTSDQVGASYDQSLALLDTLGQSDRERIDMGSARAQASANQDLINRGLGNTTIRSSVQRGIEDDRQRAQREVTEGVGRQKSQVIQQRAGSEERMGNFLAQMMEARTDRGPDTGQFAALMERVGAGQGAGADGPATMFTGLSANARAGRSISGKEFMGSGGASRGASGGGGGSGASIVRGGGGGAGGSGARVIYGGSRGASPSGGGAAIRGFSNQAASAIGGGAAQAGQGGSFDDLFLGQPVFSGGDVIGQYTGNQTYDLAPNLDLLSAAGEIDPNRIPADQGGNQQSAAGPSQEGIDRAMRIRGANRTFMTTTKEQADWAEKILSQAGM